MKRFLSIFLIATISATILFASGNSDSDSHSKSSAPNYNKLFESNIVQRIYIEISADDYEAMHQNMIDMFGEPNQGGENNQRQTRNQADYPVQGNKPMGNPGNMGPPPQFNQENNLRQLDNRQEDQRQMGPGNVNEMNGEQFLGNSEDPEYFEATIRYDGEVWEHVGIRYKGNSTLRSTWQMGLENLPFRLWFDYYEDDYSETEDQRFYGFKKMTFANMSHDMNLMHDKLASDMFRESGVKVAEAAYFEIYLDSGNGAELLGLYTMIEDPSDDFLDYQFGNDDGKLYKPEGTAARLTLFEDSLYEDKLNDSDDHSEIETLVEHLNNRDLNSESWKDRLEDIFDVESFITFLAVNNTLTNWDNYGAAPHNFYLYVDPEQNGRISFIPWDLNECFNYNNRSLTLSMDEVDASWPLIYWLMQEDEYRLLYYEKLYQFVSGPFSDGSISEYITDYDHLVEPYLSQATNIRSTNSSDIITYVENRRTEVVEFLTSVGYLDE